MSFTIMKAEDYNSMSLLAAKKVIEKIKEQQNIVLGLATGSTPEGLYRELIDDHKQNGTSYRNIKTVNLDEYIGLDKTNRNSYKSFMYEKLFQYIDIPPEHTHIPNGIADDPVREAERYDKLIEQLGGVDLQILGIGHNGHIGFNEPGTSFSSRTHIVKLENSTRMANSRLFNKVDEVPSQAITMGISSILESKEILLLASGSAKAPAIKHLLSEDVSENFPASALKLHKNVTIIADSAALK
ncbi:glucosamine-6-phosphate deaminase [Peribacillus saganii]|uniref:Glucosamine-6-phosphate deaminase n=1 Tax=Peribacillus saganii TaxID=2303992 RepID=A0A372LL76_9BACI|nr:glucosamine-6-phosphate deaminase [Peribacillus saganii]RFU66972.1 glucosamine-6-phosphate deaminase [Peribacillus saganii]